MSIPMPLVALTLVGLIPALVLLSGAFERKGQRSRLRLEHVAPGQRAAMICVALTTGMLGIGLGARPQAEVGAGERPKVKQQQMRATMQPTSPRQPLTETDDEPRLETPKRDSTLPH